MRRAIFHFRVFINLLRFNCRKWLQILASYLERCAGKNDGCFEFGRRRWDHHNRLWALTDQNATDMDCIYNERRSHSTVHALAPALAALCHAPPVRSQGGQKDSHSRVFRGQAHRALREGCHHIGCRLDKVSLTAAASPRFILTDIDYFAGECVKKRVKKMNLCHSTRRTHRPISMRKIFNYLSIYPAEYSEVNLKSLNEVARNFDWFSPFQ